MHTKDGLINFSGKCIACRLPSGLGYLTSRPYRVVVRDNTKRVAQMGTHSYTQVILVIRLQRLSIAQCGVQRSLRDRRQRRVRTLHGDWRRG